LYKSIFIGLIDLSDEIVQQTVSLLADSWCEHPYHILRHNCISFAEALVERIGLGDNFPGWLKNACIAANETQGIVYLVDSSDKLNTWYHETFHEEHSCEPHECDVNCRLGHEVYFSECSRSDEKLMKCITSEKTCQKETSLFELDPEEIVSTHGAQEYAPSVDLDVWGGASI